MANAPFGAYKGDGVAVTFPKITDLNAVPFALELKYVNGGQPRYFTGGAFEGSKFSLENTSPAAGDGAPAYIQWCPNQNYFQVTDDGVTNTLVYTPSCDSSWSVSPPRACPVHCPCVALPHCPCLSAATGLVPSSAGLATPTATPAATGPGGREGEGPPPRGSHGTPTMGQSHEWRLREGRPHDRLYPQSSRRACHVVLVMLCLCLSCCAGLIVC